MVLLCILMHEKFSLTLFPSLSSNQINKKKKKELKDLCDICDI